MLSLTLNPNLNHTPETPKQGTYSKVFPVFGNTSQTVPPTVKGSGEVAAPDLVTPVSLAIPPVLLVNSKTLIGVLPRP